MRVLLLAGFMALSMMLNAQVKKVALLEPMAMSKNVTTMQKEIIRAALEEAITSVEGYEAFTRTDIDAITSEMKFQQSGMVSDEQIKRMGAMSGADLICLTQVTLEEGDFFIKCSLIEVESGKIVRTANQLMKSTPRTEMQLGCIQLSQKLITGTVTITTMPESKPKPVDTKVKQQEPKPSAKACNGVFNIGDFCKELGGIIVDVDKTGVHGFVISIDDLGKGTWQEAVALCDKYNDSEISGWRLPTKEEFEKIFAHKAKIGGLKPLVFWTGTEYEKKISWCINLKNGKPQPKYKDNIYFVRAVRSF